MSSEHVTPELIQAMQDAAQRREEAARLLAGHICDFFAAKEWHHTKMDPEGRHMLLSFKMKQSTVRLQIVIDPPSESVRFQIDLVTCHEAYRLAMSELLTGLNYTLRYGVFHLNAAGGEVTYRHTVSYKGLPFSPEAFEDYISACVSTADREYHNIEKMANGRFTANEKIEWFKKLRQFAVALDE